MADASLLSELTWTFTDIQRPFETLDNASTELKPIDIRISYHFLFPLDHGERIVAVTHFEASMHKSCFDRLGRLLGSEEVDFSHFHQQNVAQCAPNRFVVCHILGSFMLSEYNSALHCLRRVRCKNFSHICCNSKFLFGLWDSTSYAKGSSEYDEQQDKYSTKMIQVHHLDTLSEAFGLHVPEKYTIERIVADKHHVVAISRLADPSRQWSMSIFNVATFNESDGDKSDSRGGKTARFFVAERHIELSIKSLVLSSVFPFNGWLVVHREKEKELVWFNKNGKRSETRTRLDSISNLRAIYSTVSSLLFTTVSKH